MSCADAAIAIRTAIALCVDVGWHCPSAAKITIRLIRILVGECIREIISGGRPTGATIGGLFISSTVLTLAAGGVWLVGYICARVIFCILQYVFKQIFRVPVVIRASIAAIITILAAVATLELAAGASRHADAWQAYAN